MITFVTYISKGSPEDLYYKYCNQRLLFYSSVNYNQPEGTVRLLLGEAEDGMFVEALDKLRELRSSTVGPLLYVDNDCVLMSPVNDLFEIDFDVAVVYRREWDDEYGSQRCLGGFLFFSGRRMSKEISFLDNLIGKTKEHYAKDKSKWYYDQTAVSEYVGKPAVTRETHHYHYCRPYTPCLKIVDGVMVLFLSANEWACPRSYFVPPKIYLYHYNHNLWPQLQTNST